MNAPDYRSDCRRPALTPAFICGIALWMTTATSYSLCRVLVRPACMTIAITAAVLAVASVFLALACKGRVYILYCAFLITGFALGAAQGSWMHGRCEAVGEAEPQSADLVLLEDAKDTGFGMSALALATFDNLPPCKVTASFDSDCALYYGDSLRVSGAMRACDYTDDERSWASGSCAKAYVSSFEPVRTSNPLNLAASIRKAAIQEISSFAASSGIDGSLEESSGVITAIVCGYRPGISSSEVYGYYQSCGLAHMIAVSGAHLVIITGIVAGILKALRLPRRFSICLLICIMLAYLLLSGVPISACRATAMSGIGILALLGKRRPSSLNALGITLIAIIALDPSSALSTSLALSALSTIGIVIFAPLISGYLRRTPLGSMNLIAEPLSMTIAANALSQLFACSVFDILPLVSPLANIVCAPLFPLVCGSGLLAGTACIMGLPGCEYAILASFETARLLNAVIESLAKIPFASIPLTCDTSSALLATGILAIIVWAVWPKRGLALIACAGLVLAFCAYTLPYDGTRIVMFDVGQGDSFLIQSEGRAALIDTGNSDSKLISSLAGNRIAKLDALFITHADDDHCGSIDALGKCTRIDRSFYAAQRQQPASKEDPKQADLIEKLGSCSGSAMPLQAGDEVDLGAFHIEVVWPYPEDGLHGNASSLALLLTTDIDHDGRGEFKALFTGDLESEQLESLISRGLGDIDILKVGHHGSAKSLTSDEAARLNPEIALIGVGKNNRYGHPHESSLNALDAVGCAVYRTDEDGEVTCMFDVDSLRVGKMS